MRPSKASLKLHFARYLVAILRKVVDIVPLLVQPGYMWLNRNICYMVSRTYVVLYSLWFWIDFIIYGLFCSSSVKNWWHFEGLSYDPRAWVLRPKKRSYPLCMYGDWTKDFKQVYHGLNMRSEKCIWFLWVLTWSEIMVEFSASLFLPNHQLIYSI